MHAGAFLVSYRYLIDSYFIYPIAKFYASAGAFLVSYLINSHFNYPNFNQKFYPFISFISPEVTMTVTFAPDADSELHP